MCGIAAVYSEPNASDPLHIGAVGELMLARLAHRGPDDRDHWSIGRHAWLGHTRLSIVDLDGGRQPLGSPDGWSLVCNGEIYNHGRVRARLGEENFATASDSESALALLRMRGPEALDRLQGMWALCTATADGGFVAARDRLGIKPLYWSRGGASVYFASELRAFPEGVQSSAKVFPPGCYWTPRTGVVRFADAVGDHDPRQWDGVTAEVAEKTTREVLADSVRRHLMADVDVGVFLSGGLDSSLIAAVAAAEYSKAGKRLKTFAVGTAGSPDLVAARQAARFLGTDHHEAVFDAARAIAAVDEVVASVESFDASLIRSAVPNWFLSELASRHVKAVLTGEGADELFAGYDYYHRDHGAPEELDRELERTLGQLHGLNLQRCDRVTMAHGLEARVPFLDADVIAHAMSLPPQWKGLEPDGMEKGHLRRAFVGWLPENLLWRRKVQFGTGSGAQDLLTPYFDEHVSDAELAVENNRSDENLRTKEELAYYRAFRRALPAVRPDAVLTRFATV
ncbi:MAG TPA: asparagine synthase (glutamine-hydrolyzing) [Stackebrandtia sp.]|jgi:asparagine synthase (glutamine-hydrolysing)|uniref:asparagine synthase (glutamine-hydrolyzing) n=1 Tax=Stackebrandtia sp. TaxID=2023065 RepID=UPI002D49C108|nr:asparagine synthase (glutamine-hydrolyzing) [Stackebrandtia sp.]HZE38084.1 asparagine synthase (glutamine-hydrolyzing) [Stackebrandtia sp.]